MALTQTVTVDSLDFELILIEPDWDRGVEVSHRFPTTIDLTLSGKENRRSQADYWRLRQKVSFLMNVAEGEALRETFGSLEDGRIAIPLWPEAKPIGNPPTPARYTGSWYANFDADGTLGGITSLPGGSDYHAPLLFGRLEERPKIIGITDEIAEVQIRVVEDSPPSYRTGAVVTAVGADWPTTLKPDWSKVTERTEDGLNLRTVGLGRERSVDGQEQVTRLGRETKFLLNRAEIGELLDFFIKRKGPYESFAAPAWFAPGTATAEAPHGTVVRFQRETLFITFTTPDVAVADIEFRQVPWEIAPTETYEFETVAHLFTFTYASPTPEVTRYTDYESDLVDGDTWAAAAIEIHNQGFKRDLKLRSTTLQFNAHSIPPLARFIPDHAEAPLDLVIERCDPSGVAASRVEVFRGRVRGVRALGRFLTVRATSLGGLWDRKFPSFLIQHRCNYALFSAPCGVLRASYAETGTFTSQSSGALTITTTATDAADYFAQGWIRVGTGTDFEVREIVSSVPGSGTQVLTIDRPIRQAASGQAVEFVPGCDKTAASCKTKFSNLARFGGHPFVPQDNPALKSIDVNSDGARKK